MSRLALALLAMLLLNSCSLPPVQEIPGRLLAVARDRAQAVLALQLQRRLGERIPQIVSLLAQPGGYLNNPLVRILLPPPLGLALSVGLELAAQPQTPPLQILINRAAELAIPGAGPILTETLNQIPPEELLRLLSAGETAATEELKQRSYRLVLQVVETKVAAELAQNGALQQFQALQEGYEAQQSLLTPEHQPPTEEPQPTLEQHVATAAVAGLFRLLGEEEKTLRNQLSQPEEFLPALPAVILPPVE